MNKIYLIIFTDQATPLVVDITDVPLDETTRMIRGHRSLGREIKIIGYFGNPPHLRY